MEGTLVEPTQEFFQQLQSNKRNAYLLNNCFSEKKEAYFVEFIVHGLLSGLKPTHKKFLKKEENYYKANILCVPVMSVLFAIGNPTVHLFSLDVEGAEKKVLKTIDWERVDIHVWLIEYAGDEKRKQGIVSKLVNDVANYSLVGDAKKRDLIFVRNDVIHKYNVCQFL